MKYTIDRFEGSFAVVELETGRFADIPKEAIPTDAREGDIIEVIINKKETEEKRAKVRKLEDELFAD